VPFDDANLPHLHAKIIAGRVEYPHYISSSLKSLLSRMLVVSPTKRATLAEIKRHSWLAKAEKISNYLPERSIITPPFDTEVVKRMGGFDFGNNEERISKLKLACTKENDQSTEPIVNIYHLVREKMARDDFKYRDMNPSKVIEERKESRRFSFKSRDEVFSS
jgi:serine/threonine protein kinase